MDATLHRIRRHELLKQLYMIGESFNCVTSEVVVIRPEGTVDAVVKVEECANGVFLCPFEAKNPILKLAPFFGSKVRELDLGDVVSALEGCERENVWLQWPKGEPRTVPGKVLAAFDGSKKHLKVAIFPSPKDIDAINERVHVIVSADCGRARHGTECGQCTICSQCEILKKADAEVRKEFP